MQPPKILAYLAHPVGPGSTLEELEARRENIANTLAWLQWLVDATKWAICVPWLPYVQRLDESTYRERGIEDDLACLERCDLVILTGGRISHGMAAEVRHARQFEIPVVDLTSFGFHAPDAAHTLDAIAALRMRLRDFVARPRRVWLPPLTIDQRGELKGNRAVLRAHAVDHDVIDAILAAAEVAP
jgi:hypothetical protein